MKSVIIVVALCALYFTLGFMLGGSYNNCDQTPQHAVCDIKRAINE